MTHKSYQRGIVKSCINVHPVASQPPTPLDIVSEDMDYEPYEGLSHTPLRLFYRGFPMAEPEEHMERG